MNRIATATVATRPLTTARLKTIPRRITGLYRLSIVSRMPFEVDIGGRAFNTVRTLDVFHEAPMFVDGLQNVGAVDLLNDGEFARMVRIYPAGGKRPTRFRITAHEIMPERYELERKMSVARMKTPLVYEGFFTHMAHAVHDADAETWEELHPGTAADKIANALVALFMVGSVPLLAVAAHGFLSTVAVAAVCDPSQTYINGTLFKNLTEVNVKLAEGKVVGYTYP